MPPTPPFGWAAAQDPILTRVAEAATEAANVALVAPLARVEEVADTVRQDYVVTNERVAGVEQTLAELPEPSWDGLADKPETFTPAAHSQPISSVTGLDTALIATPSAFANTAALPAWSFLQGLNNWTTTRTGLPTNLDSLLALTRVTDDAVFGICGNWLPTAIGANVLARAVVPWGRSPYRVTAKLRVLSGPAATVNLSLVAIGLNAGMSVPAFYGGAEQSVSTNGSEVTISFTFAPSADFGADYNAAAINSSLYARFGIRYGSTGAAQIRILSVLVEDATAELAIKRTSSQSIPFASRAAAEATVIPAVVQKISVLHDGEVLDYVRLPASWNQSNAPLTTAGSQRWMPAGDATIRHWGAVGDCDATTLTGTSCRLAIQAALTWLAANDVRKLVINRGNFLVEKQASAVTLRYASEHLEIVGHGMWVSNIIFRDLSSGFTGNRPLFSKLPEAIKASMACRDFSIVSDWGFGGNWNEGSHAIAVGGGGGICHFTRMRFHRIGSMCIVCSGSDRASVTDSVFEISQRDGVHATGTKNVNVSRNFFRSIGDDTVATATTGGSTQYSESVVVEGNHVIDSQGFNLVSTQSMIVRANILRRCSVRGIQAGRASGVWATGSIARFNLVIEANIVTDVMKRARFGGVGADYAYISVVDIISDGLPATGELRTIDPTPAGYTFGPDGQGGIVAPEPWFYTRDNFVGNLNVVIRNNICMRTLRPTASYLDYGFGPRYIQGVGPYTGDVIEDDFYDKHYQLKGVLRNVLLDGNVSYGAGSPLFIRDFLDGVLVEADNVVVSNNTFFDVRGAAAVEYNGAQMITAIGNRIDGDPLHRHPSRSTQGRWTVSTGLVGYMATRGKIAVQGGSVKNLGALSSVASGGQVVFSSPLMVMADLTGFGDLPENRGIRHVPRGIALTYVRTGSNPADAAEYGRVYGITETASAVMPTSGHYLSGQVVSSPNPIVSGDIVVMGWIRISTGSSHVLGTDWREIRASLS